MCWFSHDLEPYAFKAFSKRILLIWLLFGSVSPDIFTKFFIQSGWIPVAQHRHIGIGVTHTLFFGITVALIIYLFLGKKTSKSYARRAAVSFLIGQWSHALLDTLDSVGLMMFFPLSDKFFSLGLWSYAAQLGHWGDLYVFYHSLALIIETATFVLVWLKAWRFLLHDNFKKLVSEEKMSIPGLPRYERLLYVLYFYYMVASLRLPIWVFKVWFNYKPSKEALILVNNNVLYDKIFNYDFVAYLSLTLMISTLIYALYKLAKEIRTYATIILTIEGILLLFIAMYIPYEPLMSALSTISAVVATYIMYGFVSVSR